MEDLKIVGYSHEFLAEFIKLYHSQPCLWQLRCKDYKDRLLRNRAYDILAQKLREVNEYADKDTVIRKINTLRTAFRREYNKVKKSQLASDDPQDQYKSSLWYYDLLKFVAEQNNENVITATAATMTTMTATMTSTTATMTMSTSMGCNGKLEISSGDENYSTNFSTDETLMHNEVEKVEPPSPVSSRSNTPNSFHPVILGTEGSYSMDYTSPTIEHTSSTMKKRKQPDDYDREHCSRSNAQQQSSAYEVSPRKIVPCRGSDEYETFGLYVASKLKKSTERQCIIAERIIAEVLLRANFGTLEENTRLTEKTPSRCFFVMNDR